MAYGRLDVFYPDGNFRSFGLKDNSISVGRSPGNTIQLDSETLSRYHFSVTHEDGIIYLDDLESQNGTYLDGVQVPTGERRELRGGEEILAGELRLIYHEVDELPTQPVRAQVDTTQRIESANINFEVSVQPPPIAVPPGAHASAELSIYNLGEQAQVYLVEVEGVPKQWLRIDRPRLTVEGGDSEQIIINFRPTRQPQTRPGEYAVTLTIREDDQPENALVATTHVRVLPYSGMGIALERDAVASNEQFRLHLHNQGNSDLTLAVGPGKRIRDIALDVDGSDKVTLGPGERSVVQGRVRPTQSRLVGGVETYPFELVVRAQDASQFMAVVKGTVAQAAVMPTWVPIAAGAGLATLALVLLGLLTLLNTPQPAITAFSVAPTFVPRGAPVEVQWEVEDTNNLQLLVDETPIALLTPESGNFLLDTTALSENAVISIVGVAGNNADRLDQSVRIYDAMQVESFDVQPQQLVRHVVQSIDLSWNISNAEFVELSGLESFSAPTINGQQLDPEDTAEGIVGIVQEDLAITLYAEDALGNPFTEQIIIPAPPPQCTAIEESLPLRSGPNELNQTVGAIPADTSVVVTARDVTGAWVRVDLEGNLSGWGALEGLDCADNFNPADLQQEIEVTPPPAAPATTTPQATATEGTPSVAPLQPTTSG